VIAPEGTVVNVKPPAPVSLNTTSGGQTAKFVVKSVLMQMLSTSKKWRREVMAHNVGQRIARHAGVNQYGRFYASSFALGAFAGSGARASRDGVDSGHSHLTCPNAEWVELNFPLLHLFRRHIQDGGGAGKFRGGVGGETAVVVHDAPDDKIKVVAYGVTGLRNSGIGIFGGYPGAPSIIAVVERVKVEDLLSDNSWPADIREFGDRVRLLPYSDFDLKRGEVLYMRQANGGGCADPLDRDPKQVQKDMLEGMVSRKVSRDIYGVAFDDLGNLDAAATKVLRETLSSERSKDAFLCEEISGSSEKEQSYPSAEILEVDLRPDGAMIRCRGCGFTLSPLGEDWRRHCRARYLPPSRAGTPMNELTGHYVLLQLSCPSCGKLLDNRMVEDKNRKNSQIPRNG
jgi:N-methylhydantoinase B